MPKYINSNTRLWIHFDAYLNPNILLLQYIILSSHAKNQRSTTILYYMVPTLKCLDVGDHIFAVVYTTLYVRQIWVGAVYYTARTYIGHEDLSSVPPPLYTLSTPPLSTPSLHSIYTL